MNRNELLDKIRAVGFAMHEAALFLDTHPECKAALEYYKNTLEALDELMSEYQNKFGPLFAEGVVGDRWSWVDGKWPWQLSEEDN